VRPTCTSVCLGISLRVVITSFFYLMAASVCRSQSSYEIGALGVLNITKSSSGQFVSGPSPFVAFDQSSGTGVGETFQLQRWWAKNGVLLSYSKTPTDSVLVVHGDTINWNSVDVINSARCTRDGSCKWDLTRHEFNVLLARQLLSGPRNSLQAITGLTAILLDGGKASGLDRQFAFAVGAANDHRLSSHLAFRSEFLANFLRASAFSDPTYRPSRTVVIETRVGFIWRFAATRAPAG
jgi:hypothetical protein